MQGRGVASRLIRPFLDRADSEHVGAYTETMTPSNVPLYEHFGFRCQEAYAVPKTGPDDLEFGLRPIQRRK